MLIYVVMRFAILLWTLLAMAALVRGADLCSFKYQGKVLAFVVPSSDPVAATVDENTVANLALKWAIGFYGVNDINVDEIEFRVNPTRFWLVRFSVSDGSAHQALYGVVLPDGSIVDPIVRDWL